MRLKRLAICFFSGSLFFSSPDSLANPESKTGETLQNNIVLAAPSALTVYEIGRLVQTQGTVKSLALGQKEFSPVKLGDPIWGFSVLQTGPESKARLTLLDETIFVLGPNSEVQFTRYLFDGTSGKTFCLFDLKKGELLLSVAKHPKEARQSSYEVETDKMIIATRGSEMMVRYDGASHDIANLGKMHVYLQNRAGEIATLETGMKLSLAGESLSAPGVAVDADATRLPFQWESQRVKVGVGFVPEPPKRLTDLANFSVPAPWVRNWPVEDVYEEKPLWYPKTKRELKRQAKENKKLAAKPQANP